MRASNRASHSLLRVFQLDPWGHMRRHNSSSAPTHPVLTLAFTSLLLYPSHRASRTRQRQDSTHRQLVGLLSTIQRPVSCSRSPKKITGNHSIGSLSENTTCH
ncbi:hypothetical protein LX36DRAFT_313851 [Colletotrichum falcatum]|nr:hypothetical protein LX36DRAFT_313851 [Colletotrichum falcatum]